MMSDSEDDAVDLCFIPLGPLHGWFCAGCGQTRLGYPTEAEARSGASGHAMDEHAPEGGWIGGARSVEVVWADEEDE